MTDHKAAAEDYLEQAAALVDTPRIGVARTLAEVAQAHATLALVDAVRDISKVTVATTEVREFQSAYGPPDVQAIIGRRLADLMDDDLEPMARTNADIREGLIWSRGETS